MSHLFSRLIMSSAKNSIDEDMPYVTWEESTDSIIGGDGTHKSYPTPCSKYVYAHRKQGSTTIFRILVGLTPCTWGLKIGTSPNVIKI